MIKYNLMQLILLLIFANIWISIIKNTFGVFLSKKVKVTNFNFMNELYIITLTDLFCGSIFYGIIFMLPQNTNFVDMGIGFLYGMVIYMIFSYFTDMRKYNKVQDAMKTFNINTDEEFAEFLKKEGVING